MARSSLLRLVLLGALVVLNATLWAGDGAARSHWGVCITTGPGKCICHSIFQGECSNNVQCEIDYPDDC